MNRVLRKTSIATLVMGTSVVGMAGVTFAGTDRAASLTPIYATATNTYQVYTANQLEYIDQNQSNCHSAN